MNEKLKLKMTYLIIGKKFWKMRKKEKAIPYQKFSSWKMVLPTFSWLISKFGPGLGPTYVQPNDKASHQHERVCIQTPLHVLRQNCPSTPPPSICNLQIQGLTLNPHGIVLRHNRLSPTYHVDTIPTAFVIYRFQNTGSKTSCESLFLFYYHTK